MPFTLNTWYHNKAIYDPTSDMFTLEITRKDDGVLLGTYTLAAVGEFLNIERLGISCTQSTYGDRLQAGCIDNVVLYVVPEPKPPPVYYVDSASGSDDKDGLTRRTAFATIRKGINSARNGFKVLVYPGVYSEEINFCGKAITIQGVATKAGIPIIENPGDFAVSFYNGEGPRSILKNFVIEKSFMGIFIAGSSPTIKNLNIVDNKYGIEAYAGSEPDISNCIFWENSDSDLFGCEARYSCTSQLGQGNINADPCFVDPNKGDYHLLSQRGRYWPRPDVWVLDKVTSPCIDGGDPYDAPADEPMPNGGRIDMGAFGGTPFASMSDIKWLDGDINHDGVVNLIDLAILGENWLATAERIPFYVPSGMVLISGGTFQMGDSFSEGDSSERPTHTVTVNSFYMDKYDITNGQYCQYLNSVLGSSIYVADGGMYGGDMVYGSGNNQPYCGTSDSYYRSLIDYSGGVFSVRIRDGRNMSNDPMIYVSWYGAAAYCNWLSQQEGKEPCYNLSTWEYDFSKNGYRLPTEAEWEYAARGGLSGKRFPWGDTISHSQTSYWSYWEEGHPYYQYDVNPTEGCHPIWSSGGVSPYTAPVGSFAANGYGLYDMAGNACQWCNDWYGAYNSNPQTNPTGPANGNCRIYRGGGGVDTAYNCRVSYRNGSYFTPDDYSIHLGFRVVLPLAH